MIGKFHTPYLSGLLISNTFSLTTNLISYWEFEKNLLDTYGNNHAKIMTFENQERDGFYLKTNQGNTGKFGSYIGGLGFYELQLPNIEDFKPSVDYTISFWTKISKSGEGSGGTCLSINGNGDIFILKTINNPDGNLFSPMSIKLSIGNLYEIIVPNITQWEWHHVVITVKDYNTYAKANLYVDNKKYSVKMNRMPQFNAGQVLKLVPYLSNSIKGFDDLAIWNKRSLNDEEISYIYSSNSSLNNIIK